MGFGTWEGRQHILHLMVSTSQSSSLWTSFSSNNQLLGKLVQEKLIRSCATSVPSAFVPNVQEQSGNTCTTSAAVVVSDGGVYQDGSPQAAFIKKTPPLLQTPVRCYDFFRLPSVLAKCSAPCTAAWPDHRRPPPPPPFLTQPSQHVIQPHFTPPRPPPHTYPQSSVCRFQILYLQKDTWDRSVHHPASKPWRWEDAEIRRRVTLSMSARIHFNYKEEGAGSVCVGGGGFLLTDESEHET